MHTQKAVVSCRNIKDTELTPYALRIADALTDNEYFPDPEPSIETLRTEAEAFAEALMVSIEHKSKVNTDIKNEKRESLSACINALAQWVNLKAKGDKIQLDSSGFELTKEHQKIELLRAPKTQSFSEGANPGEIAYDVEKVPHSSGTVIFYSPTPAPEMLSEWSSITTSRQKGTITGLKSETKYTFKAAALSPYAQKNDHYNFTDPISKMVQ